MPFTQVSYADNALVGNGRAVAPTSGTVLCSTPFLTLGVTYQVWAFVAVAQGTISATDVANVNLGQQTQPNIMNVVPYPAPGSQLVGPINYTATASGNGLALVVVSNAGTGVVYAGAIVAIPYDKF
jgi:hypothetical protein